MALMKTLDPRVSFAELQLWPDDGRRYELYDGEAIVVPSALPRHQRVALHIGYVLVEYERVEGGIVFSVPIDIVFSDYDVLQPDVVYFRLERRHLLDMMRPTRVAPDLAVEVLSRSTGVRDRGRKMKTFAKFSVPEYWIVDPVVNTLEVFRLEAAGYTIEGMYGPDDTVTSPTLKGLTFPAASIFAE